MVPIKYTPWRCCFESDKFRDPLAPPNTTIGIAFSDPKRQCCVRDRDIFSPSSDLFVDLVLPGLFFLGSIYPQDTSLQIWVWPYNIGYG
jgi:hypothetical protein